MVELLGSDTSGTVVSGTVVSGSERAGKELSAGEVWRATLGELQLQLPRNTFDTWLKPTEGISYRDSQFVVEVPTPFAVAWLERRMYQFIQKTVEKVTGGPADIQFQVKASNASASNPPAGAAVRSTAPNLASAPAATAGLPAQPAGEGEPAPAPARQSTASTFNPRYRFDSFVVGPSNRLAFSAAQAVVEAPGKMYNPLFIYSGVGLGKTHLLHAIGQASTDLGLDALYVSSEQFTNEFISAIRYRTTEEFRSRYRSVQVLLIDDIQFMSGKEQTQEGFFHTFNDLHNSGQQIVITSDRPPKTLALLEDRLRSRFEWGLIADIQPPALETRMAILKSKAEEHQLSISDGIIEFIAKRVQKNVRELEGSLNRVVAYSDLMDVPVTLELASRVLQDLATDAARHSPDPGRIIDEASHYYKISTTELLGRSRTKNIALARQVAMYLLMYELEMSPTQIGRLLGGRDHSTVIHGAGKINGEINEDHQLRLDVLTIKEALFN